MDKKDFSHLDKNGYVKMVDVSHKQNTLRKAVAYGKICLNSETLDKIKQFGIKKGDVLTTAKLAGIQAAKETSRLIPLCHPISLTHINITTQFESDGIGAFGEVHSIGPTGVEMEALTGTMVALLTIYDMCKAIDRNMIITDLKLLEKTKEDL